MKSAIGNVFVMNFVIIFTVVFIGLFVTSLSYTKALKIKNKITDIIEENKGYNSDAIAEIQAYLKDAGYRISAGSASTCKYKDGTGYDLVYPSTATNNYDYCIFRFTESEGRTYYGVKTYMYLDIPLIGDLVKIGVYGETKTIGLLG